MAVTCFGSSLDRLAVRDPRFKYLDIETELVLDFLCDDFKVKLADTVNEELFELGVVDHLE